MMFNECSMTIIFEKKITMNNLQSQKTGNFPR